MTFCLTEGCGLDSIENGPKVPSWSGNWRSAGAVQMFSSPFGGTCADRISATRVALENTSQTHRSRATAPPWLALAISVLTVSAARAENCTLPAISSSFYLGAVASSPASVSSVIGSAVVTANTAILLPSTVFVGGSSNPATNQQSGGFWTLGLGGTIGTKTNTSTNATQSSSPIGSVPALPGNCASVKCFQKVDETFAGVQIGSDIARLNLNGWNLHLGTTVRLSWDK